MKKALVIVPSLAGRGGGNCVVAWMMQALHEDFDVTVLTWQLDSAGNLNARYETGLRDDDFAVVTPPLRWKFWRDRAPDIFRYLWHGVLQAQARTLLARGSFDLVVSGDDIVDVGRPVIQYVHYPWTGHRRQASTPTGGRLPTLRKVYHPLVDAVFGISNAGTAGHVTLVNSQWTAMVTDRTYGTRAQVLYPPVPVRRPETESERRPNRFICVGRFDPCKRWLEAIDILARVRERGHDVSLLICGHPVDRAYTAKVRAAAKKYDWVEVALDLPRQALLQEISASQYGLHPMPHEHFGIAIAEMRKLGCICFTAKDGGAREILEDRAELLFGDDREAVERICHLLSDEGTRQEIIRTTMRTDPRFDPEEFMEHFRGICAEFLARDRCATLP